MKVIGKIFSVIRNILFFVMLLILIVILTQRLSNNKMAVAGLRLFTVVTESMMPEYLIGDTLLVRSVPIEELREGDDITYIGEKESFKDRIVTHRIIGMARNEDGTYKIKTKGIANDEEDPEINGSQVYGKVLYKVKSISYLNGIVGNLNSMYFLIVVPMAIIVFVEYRGYKKDKELDKLEIELERETGERIKLEEDDTSDRKERRKRRREKIRARHRK